MKESEFTRLFMPLRDRMFRYAQSLLLSSAEAEDVVHKALKDSRAGRALSIFGLSMRAAFLGAKFVPHSLILKMMQPR